MIVYQVINGVLTEVAFFPTVIEVDGGILTDDEEFYTVTDDEEFYITE
jgi:hypothetical protein